MTMGRTDVMPSKLEAAQLHEIRGQIAWLFKSRPTETFVRTARYHDLLRRESALIHRIHPASPAAQEP
jgi:hypothetical protein